MKKAQAGLDFLMTYGWALLLIVLVIGALFALGIFDLGTFMGSKASGFTQVGVVGWRMDTNGTLTAMFRNQAGTAINVTGINATYGTQTVSYTTPIDIDNGKQSGTITVGTFSSPPSKGSSYSVKMDITYTDKATGFSYATSGTVTGNVN